VSTPDDRDPYAPPAEDAPRPTVTAGRRGRPASPAVRPRPRPRPTGPVLRGGVGAFLLSALGALLATFLLPLSVGGFVCCVGGVVLGLRTRRAARAQHGIAPGALGAVVTGVLGALLAGSISVFGIVFHQELSTYQECMRGANTVAAQESCQQPLQQLRDRFRQKAGVSR
jgi:hypothetical protein